MEEDGIRTDGLDGPAAALPDPLQIGSKQLMLLPQGISGLALLPGINPCRVPIDGVLNWTM